MERGHIGINKMLNSGWLGSTLSAERAVCLLHSGHGGKRGVCQLRGRPGKTCFSSAFGKYFRQIALIGRDAMWNNEFAMW